MGDSEPLRLRFDAFELDESDARLTRDGRHIPLPPRAFGVLCALARQPGQLVTKTALLDAVWGHQHVSESVLKTTISELRAALSDDARQPRYIETASRRGYRFIGASSVRPVRDAARAGAVARPMDVGTETARAPAPPMIGRRAALGRLRVAWNEATAGRRQVFWIAGEAGVGKTTLIDGLLAEFGPAACAHGQCVEQFGAGEPYLPVLEALAALCRRDPALAPMLQRIAPTWLLQLPWLSSEAERQALQRELAGASPDRMLRELGELLDRYTQERPLLLVTEDLHWSDQATVRLIDHIARRRSAARLMWVGSFRLAELMAGDHPLKGLRHELRMHRLCDEIVLDPFSEQEVADYVETRFPGTGASEAFVRAVHARTDGLPLFVVNVIDDLAAQGALRADAARPVAQAPAGDWQVPESLAGVMEKQIVRLPGDVRALLEAASVCGVEFRPRAVAEALERETPWVGEQFDELARRGLWIDHVTVEPLPDGTLDARYAFRHALYRQVFYQRIGALTRARLHGRVAASLARARAAGLPVTAAELASHFELSHEFMAALRHYAEAAESALRHFAPGEATSLTAHALDLLPRCPDGAMRDAQELALAAMQGVAAAQLRGVSSLEAKLAFERARTLLETLPQHPLRGLVLHGLSLSLLVRGEYAEARALGEHVHALSDVHQDRAMLLCAASVLGQVDSLQGRYRAARDWLEQGVAACEELGDEGLRAAFGVVDPGVTLYAVLAIPLLHLGLADQARARLDTAIARAQRLGQPMASMVVMWFGALFEVRRQEPARVAELAAGLRRVVDDAALAQGEGPSRWFRGWAEAHLGTPKEAFPAIREAYEHNAGLGMLSGGSEVLCYAAEALFLAGQTAQAQAQLEEAMQLARRLDERVYLTQMLVLQARIALARGDRIAARDAMQAALREAREQGAPWLELTVLVAMCERDDPPHEALDALKQAHARLTEGFDTALVRRAQALLAAC